MAVPIAAGANQPRWSAGESSEATGAVASGAERSETATVIPVPGALPLPTTMTPDMPGWYVHANG